MTTIYDKHNNALTIDGGNATLNGMPISTKIQPRANGTSFYINYNGATLSFGNLTTEQANAINDYNAKRISTRNASGIVRAPKNFIHSTDYASIDEMLTDTLAPVEVVKMRSIVNARKVSKECFMREASIKLEQAKREYEELLTAWETANLLTDTELDAQLEQLRKDCNKQFAIDRIAKMNKKDLQTMLADLLNK